MNNNMSKMSKILEGLDPTSRAKAKKIIDDLHKVIGSMAGVKATPKGFGIKYQKYTGSPDDNQQDGTYKEEKDPMAQTFHRVMDVLAKSPEFKGKISYKENGFGGWVVTLDTDPILYSHAAVNDKTGRAILADFDTKEVMYKPRLK